MLIGQHFHEITRERRTNRCPIESYGRCPLPKESDAHKGICRRYIVGEQHDSPARASWCTVGRVCFVSCCYMGTRGEHGALQRNLLENGRSATGMDQFGPFNEQR